MTFRFDFNQKRDSRPASSGQARRILVVDDHPLFRRGLKILINAQKDLAVCGEADSFDTGLEALRTLNPDAVLLDITLPGANGIELLKTMLSEMPGLPILMLSMHDESQYALRALRAGAQGYVMKGEATDQVLDGLRKILAGDIYISARFGQRLIFQAIQAPRNGRPSPVDRLTNREREVLELLGQGCGSRDIASRLKLSTKTVETHRGHIKEKLSFRDAGEMIRFAIDWTAATSDT